MNMMVGSKVDFASSAIVQPFSVCVNTHRRRLKLFITALCFCQQTFVVAQLGCRLMQGADTPYVRLKSTGGIGSQFGNFLQGNLGKIDHGTDNPFVFPHYLPFVEHAWMLIMLRQAP